MPKPVDKFELFTLGYEGLTPDRYFDIVQASGAETLVDVRRVPMSRKPGYSKKRLAEAAELRGMRYVHMVALGTPREIMYAFREKHDHPAFVKGVSEYLDTQPEAIQELADLAAQESCCLLCVEADPNLCHRKIVAERVQELVGTERCEVVHLSGMEASS